MNVLTPVTSSKETEDYVKLGVKEFYIGYLENSWLLNYNGQSHNGIIFFQ